MSRRVMGEDQPAWMAQTSAVFYRCPEIVLHRLVIVTCDGCGREARTFDRRMPDGWIYEWHPYGGSEFCSVACKPQYEEGTAFA